MNAARAIRLILWLGGLGVCLFGVSKAFQAFGLMFDGKPTGASLTMSFGFVLMVMGLAIFGAGFLFRGKEKSSGKKV